VRAALILILLLSAPALRAEDEERAPAPAKPEEPPKGAGDVEMQEPGTRVEDSAVARQEVTRFNRDWKEASDVDKRIELLERLGRFDHPEVYRALSKYLKDKDHRIAVAAICAIARQSQSQDKAGKALLGAAKREKRTPVVCALIVGMGQLGYDNKSAISEVEKVFQKDKTEPHKAAIRYFGLIKYKPAFRKLAEELDEPVAKNPNDPNNPPASWWKERWEEWNTNVRWTRWSISQLVEGETFDTTAEAKQWAENHGRDHGIEW